MKNLVALVLALATSFSLAACSEDEGHGGHNSSSSDIAESEDFNQADVDFATDMIQHHAQALSMVDLTVGRDLSPGLTQLAEQIRQAQGPEIELMVDWLNDWDQPIPETPRDHVNAHGDGEMEMDHDMPGMMSAEDMEALEAAQGEEFEQMFLEMMIEHHEGAVEMAETEQADGEYPDAIDLAGTIVDTQQDEIDQMQSLLES
ncbi:DUF305 domain-containing protein [Nocardioides silvaticus]|uniref:DUF305 domain-containing protein n=1 Tax=Nocardioides silvaticus TaxID=2201891 RepID=A0A316TRM2_9ACTN|nr:DUF305 domain-containing protein [Nocardioides silvaticus]PWN02266.1 DUF305 domain-containing protein [Nocardioides silvaticus]